jgi:CRP-like cAMP-binding protein
LHHHEIREARREHIRQGRARDQPVRHRSGDGANQRSLGERQGCRVQCARHGRIFGEIALLDGHPRTADATAITDCELCVVERQDFLPVVREEPEIALRLIEILCSRLRRTTGQVGEAMFLDLPSRLAKALMRLLEADTASMRDRKISITQKDLSKITGMSRESTNKQLRLWEDKKWVRLERNAVVILAIDPIAAIADDGGTHGA